MGNEASNRGGVVGNANICQLIILPNGNDGQILFGDLNSIVHEMVARNRKIKFFYAQFFWNRSGKITVWNMNGSWR